MKPANEIGLLLFHIEPRIVYDVSTGLDRRKEAQSVVGAKMLASTGDMPGALNVLRTLFRELNK